MVSIRLIERSEINQVSNILKRGMMERFGEDEFNVEYCPDIIHIDDWYLDRGHPLFVAELDQQVIGCISLINYSHQYDNLPNFEPQWMGDHQFPRDQLCRIVRLGVLKQQRKSGTGMKLLERVIEHAKVVLNKKLILTETNLDWFEPQRLYQRLGFEEVWRDDECVHFVKLL